MTSDLPAPRPRAADHDRLQAAETLSGAYSQGMLTFEEFTDRQDRAWACTHRDELDALVADLPVTSTPAVPAALARSNPLVVDRPGISTSLAVMSGTVRAGEWTAGGQQTAVAIMGGVRIDLREATFSQRETHIFAVAIMGGVEVVVPPHVHVRVSGIPLMGGFGADGPSADPSTIPADAPVVTVRGLAVMGGVTVKRVPHGIDVDRSRRMPGLEPGLQLGLPPGRGRRQG